MKAEEALKIFKKGTTCFTGVGPFAHRYWKPNTIFWQSNTGRFFILKHEGHNEWCGSWSGQTWCGTEYLLYDGEASDFNPTYLQHEKQNGCLKVWEGRFLKKYWKDVEKIVDKIEL